MSILEAAAVPDPSQALVTCEICGARGPIAVMHSIKALYFSTGDARVAALECLSLQHWACDPEHARIAAVACIDEHLIPQHAAMIAAAETRGNNGTS